MAPEDVIIALENVSIVQVQEDWLEECVRLIE